MSNDYSLELQTRQDKGRGRGASRHLRRNGLVPGILYGGDKAPEQFTVPHNIFIKCLEDEGFYTNLVTLTIDGKKQKALLKDLQRHPYKRQIMHADFQRVTGNETLHRHVPLHFLNEETAVGVKLSGGTVFKQLKDVEVTCSANDLPSFIEVDLTNLELNQTLHLSDLTLSKGVTLTTLALGEDHNLPVVTINVPKVQAEPVEEATPEEGEEGAESGTGTDEAKKGD